MSTWELTDPARSELLEAAERLSKLTGNPAAGEALLEQIVAAFDLLAGMPRVGRPRPEFGARLRSHVVGNHTLIYRTFRDHIRIERVIHSRRDLRRAFARQKRRKIKVTPEFEDAVWFRVDSGSYASTDEVLTACVRALERAEAEEL